MKRSIQWALSSAAARLHRASRNPRRDAELLLMHLLDCGQTKLLAYPETELSATQSAEFELLVERRLRSEPIQYITGKQEFFGFSIQVTPGVLIPRPETEHLVESLLERVGSCACLRIVDVGTGSGAIAIALAHTLSAAEIIAIDCSRAALDVARQNIESHGLSSQIRLLQSDLLAGIEPESCDAVISNPPYIPEGEELEAQVANFEPHSALFAGATGLEVYERLIPQARAVLKPDGWLMLEIGCEQQEAVSRLLDEWQEVSFVQDLRGIPRVAIARKLEPSMHL